MKKLQENELLIIEGGLSIIGTLLDLADDGKLNGSHLR